MSDLNLRKMVEEAEVNIIRANPEYKALLRVVRASDQVVYEEDNGNALSISLSKKDLREALKRLPEGLLDE